MLDVFHLSRNVDRFLENERMGFDDKVRSMQGSEWMLKKVVETVESVRGEIRKTEGKKDTWEILLCFV